MTFSRIVHYALAGVSAICIVFAGVQLGLRLHASSVVTPEAAVAVYDGANVSGQLRITVSGDFEVTREDGQVFAFAPHEVKAVIKASPAQTPSPWLVLAPMLASLVLAGVVLAWMIASAPSAPPPAQTSRVTQRALGSRRAPEGAPPDARTRPARPAPRSGA